MRTISSDMLKRSLAAVGIAASVTAAAWSSVDLTPVSDQPVSLAAVTAPADTIPVREVNCNGAGDEFTKVSFHQTGSSDQQLKCFMGHGQIDMPDNTFTTSIHTGNNTVKFIADGREQPDSGKPFGKNTENRVGPVSANGARVDQIDMNP